MLSNHTKEFGVQIYTIILTLVLSILYGNGCAYNRKNLISSGTITLEISSNSNVKIYNVKIYPDHDGIIISGKAFKEYNFRDSIPGHVDITILSTDGKALKRVSTHLDRHFSRRQVWTTFNTRISVINPAVSHVRLSYHSYKFDPKYGCMDDEINI